MGWTPRKCYHHQAIFRGLLINQLRAPHIRVVTPGRRDTNKDPADGCGQWRTLSLARSWRTHLQISLSGRLHFPAVVSPDPPGVHWKVTGNPPLHLCASISVVLRLWWCLRNCLFGFYLQTACLVAWCTMLLSTTIKLPPSLSMNSQRSLATKTQYLYFFSLLADFSSPPSFLDPTPSLSLHVAFSHVSWRVAVNPVAFAVI